MAKHWDSFLSNCRYTSLLLIRLTSADLIRPRENPVRLPFLLPNASGLQGACFPVGHELMLLSLFLGHYAFCSCNSDPVLPHLVG